MTEIKLRVTRAEQGQRFVMVPTDTVMDKRLSHRDLGVLVHLADLPATMDMATRIACMLDGEGREGRDAIRASLKRLREFGYPVDGPDPAIRER